MCLLMTVIFEVLSCRQIRGIHILDEEHFFYINKLNVLLALSIK